MRSYRTEIEPRLRERLQTVCDAAGLDAAEAQLLKFTNNAVFWLPGNDCVVRIAGSVAMHRRTRKVIEVARWLAEHNYPAVRLSSSVQQPVEADGEAATVWKAVHAVEQAPTAGQLGALLRRLHALPAPITHLPKFDPVGDIRWRLEHADGLDDVDLLFLKSRCDSLQEELDGLATTLPSGVVHGDAQVGNLIAGPEGPVLCDFDSVCIGPREWDLVPIVFGQSHYGDGPEGVQAMVTAYGADVRSMPGFVTLMRARELKLVTSAVPVIRTNSRLREEFFRRLASIRNGVSDKRWTRYS